MRRKHRATSKRPSNSWHLFLWIPVGICAVVALLFLIGVLPVSDAPAPSPSPSATLGAATFSPSPLPSTTPEEQVQPSPTALPPSGKPQSAPQTRYEIAAALSAEHNRITANMSVIYRNTTNDTLYELVFYLPPNAYARADSPGAVNEIQSYPNGFSKGGVIISDVSLNGTLAYYSVSDDNLFLHVPFLKELSPGEEASVFLEFVVDIPERDARYGHTELGYQLGNIFPILAVYQDGDWATGGYAPYGDPFYSEVADYKVIISYPETLTLAATGSIVTEEAKGGVKTSSIAASRVRDFAMVLCEGMQRATDTHQGVRIYSYALSEGSALRGAQHAKEALEAYTKYIGAYPYETLTVAQTDMQYAAGMEYPTLIMIRRDLYLAGQEQQLAFTIYHEIAHQWFYGVVGSDQLNAPWIDEALAAYFGFLPFSLQDTGVYHALAEYYLDERATEGGRIDGPLSSYQDSTQYSNSVYWRGALLYHQLRHELGDDVFFSGIASYVGGNAYGIATKEEIVAAFEEASGQPLEDWFDAMLQAPEKTRNNVGSPPDTEE